MQKAADLQWEVDSLRDQANDYLKDLETQGRRLAEVTEERDKLKTEVESLRAMVSVDHSPELSIHNNFQ